eukprot:5714464-Alexandrium_andersonii.AAC.1
MAAAQRVWGKFVVQRSAELTMVGGPVMQGSERGAVTRQQALALTLWPRAGRGTSPLPPRTLLHHPSEEPLSLQVVAQASAA